MTLDGLPSDLAAFDAFFRDGGKVIDLTDAQFQRLVALGDEESIRRRAAKRAAQGIPNDGFTGD